MVLDRVDLKRIVETAIESIDLTEIVRTQVDVASLAEEVIEEVNLPEIIRESSTGVAAEVVDTARISAVSGRACLAISARNSASLSVADLSRVIVAARNSAGWLALSQAAALKWSPLGCPQHAQEERPSTAMFSVVTLPSGP